MTQFVDMPYEQLLLQKKEIESAIVRRRAAELAELRQQIVRLIESRGFSVSEVLNPALSKAKKADVRYRHPDNPELTWTGRGKRPNWLRQFEEAGGAIETCRVG